MFHWLTRRGLWPRALTILTGALVGLSLAGCGSGGGPAKVVVPDDPAPVPNFASEVTIISVAINGDLVEVCYSIVDANSDLVDIIPEWSTTGGASYTSATEEPVFPSEGRTGLTSSPTGEGHCYVWNAGVDGVGVSSVSEVVFRVTPNDGTAVGTPGVSVPFDVFNPAVIVDVGTTTALFGATAIQVPLRMTTNGTDPVSVTTVVDYDPDVINPSAMPAVIGPAGTAAGATLTAIDTSLTGRISVTVSGPSVMADGIIAFLQFDAFIPVTMAGVVTDLFCIDVSAVSLSLAPLPAVCGLDGAIFLTPNLAPSCNIDAPVGGTVFSTVTGFLGDVQVDYTLFDAEGDLVDVTVEYSIDGGLSFSPATEVPGAPSEGTVGLTATAGGDPHVFVWDADLDVPTLFNMAENAILRVIATDVSAGTPCLSGSFVIDLRNSPPQCAPMNLVTVGASGNISIDFDVTDVEGDFVDIVFEYSNGGPFVPATAALASGFPSPALSQPTPIIGGTFVWDSGADLGPVMAVVTFRLTPGDAVNPVLPVFSPRVTSCTSAPFNVDNTARVFNSLVVLGPGSALGAGANVVTGGFTPGDPCSADLATSDFAFSLGGPSMGELTQAVEFIAGANPLVLNRDGDTAQLVVQGNFAGLGAALADISAMTTADGDTTYVVNAGPGGPYTTVDPNGLVTALLVGTNGQSGCDSVDVTFTPNGMGMAGGSNGAPMTVTFAACIDYYGYDQTSRLTLLADGDWDAGMIGTPSGVAPPGAGGNAQVIYVGRSAPMQDPSAFQLTVTYDPATMAPDTAFATQGVAVCPTPPRLPPWTSISNPTLGPNQWLVNGFRVIAGAPIATSEIESICAISWTYVAAGPQVMTTLVEFWSDAATADIVGTFALPFDCPAGSAGFTLP